MDFDALKATYSSAGQAHLFAFEASLSDAEKVEFAADLASVDLEAVQNTFAVTKKDFEAKLAHDNKITPCPTIQLKKNRWC